MSLKVVTKEVISVKNKTKPVWLPNLVNFESFKISCFDLKVNKKNFEKKIQKKKKLENN